MCAAVQEGDPKAPCAVLPERQMQPFTDTEKLKNKNEEQKVLMSARKPEMPEGRKSAWRRSRVLCDFPQQKRSFLVQGLVLPWKLGQLGSGFTPFWTGVSQTPGFLFSDRLQTAPEFLWFINIPSASLEPFQTELLGGFFPGHGPLKCDEVVFGVVLRPSWLVVGRIPPASLDRWRFLQAPGS